eukprot:gnl/TRDRNA2_/TRDRNA2_176829_c3_seq10.p1 gnl/TRDRNA2_/TRDRNA2_176829_c3~~gnl/TRDRNA2_/TRDRNA2_176829_c3_seq10.p1  ORF type:complete len:291 (+),score=29.99 gnl/TRDRNA2_/TRDRNA2_176829_c3_seq10:269-1141(+)
MHAKLETISSIQVKIHQLLVVSPRGVTSNENAQHLAPSGPSDRLGVWSLRTPAASSNEYVPQLVSRGRPEGLVVKNTFLEYFSESDDAGLNRSASDPLLHSSSGSSSRASSERNKEVKRERNNKADSFNGTARPTEDASNPRMSQPQRGDRGMSSRPHSGVQDESVPGSRTTGIRYATPGSAQHEAGLCRPCLWFTTERGCVYGADRCNNCHFEHPGRAKPSKSKRDNIRRRAAILAEKEKAAAAAAAAKPEAAAAAAQYAAPASSAPAAAGVAPRDSTKKTAVPTRISL